MEEPIQLFFIFLGTTTNVKQRDKISRVISKFIWNFLFTYAPISCATLDDVVRNTWVCGTLGGKHCSAVRICYDPGGNIYRIYITLSLDELRSLLDFERKIAV